MEKIITIITVVYNEVDKIENTVLSILKLKSPIIEYVVIDAKSSDGTLQVLQKYKDHIDQLISESDNGIYNAMNKGINNSKGKFLLFINAGDTILNLPPLNTFNLDFELFCFPVKVNNKMTRVPYLDWRIKLKNSLPHQGIFYRKSDFLKFDEELRIFSDYDLNIRYFRFKKNNIFCAQAPVVANHNLDGISNRKSAERELFSVINNHFGIFWTVVSFIHFKIRGFYFRIANVKI